jgi:endonuclease III
MVETESIEGVASGRAMTPGERARAAARRLRDAYGTPRFEPGEDPLDCLIDTILSQKTTTVSCRVAFKRLRATCGGDWGRLPATPLAEIEAAIRPAGLARSKAPRLVAVIGRIVGDFGAASLERLRGLDDAAAERYLESLPGVGPKTAKCVLMFALGREVLPVDTHVGRLGRRLGLVACGLSTRRTHAALAALVPPGERYAFHLNGFRHGRGVCLALGRAATVVA